MLDFTDKLVLLTGGASGIGASCARRFHAAGATVVVGDRATQAGEALVAELGERARFVELDVTDEGRWAELVAELEAEEGRLDVLVNSAGIGVMGSVEDTSIEHFRLVHAVNVEGVFLACRAAMPLLRAAGERSGDAAIINLSSIAGMRGVAKLAAYCSSKGAVRLLTKSIAMHCAEQGYKVRCNSLHPSFIDTPMVERMIAGAPDPERMRKILLRVSPAGRFGRPEEVADVVLFLASPGATYINGAELPVDGGATTR